VGHHADQYGAAATLYYLLTGQYTYDFPADDLQECLSTVLHEDARPIDELRPDVPDGLADVIHRALDRDPDSRYPDAQAMRRALAPWATSERSE
jgi:serine/threonine-protein kinase